MKPWPSPASRRTPKGEEHETSSTAKASQRTASNLRQCGKSRPTEPPPRHCEEATGRCGSLDGRRSIHGDGHGAWVSPPLRKRVGESQAQACSTAYSRAVGRVRGSMAQSVSAQKMAGMTMRVPSMLPRCRSPARRSPVTETLKN